MEEKETKQLFGIKQTQEVKPSKSQKQSKSTKLAKETEANASETVKGEQPVYVDPWERLLFGDRRKNGEDGNKENKGFSWI